MSLVASGQRGGEGRAFATRKPQRHGEGTQSVCVGATSLATLEGAEGIAAEPGPRSQLLLRQARRFAQALKPCPERQPLVQAHRLRVTEGGRP
jgi:hypothetical protein